MDFFERQDKARHHTKLLVGYFVLAVAGIIVTLYLVALVALNGAHTRHVRVGPYQFRQTEFVLWDPGLFLWVAGGTLVVILVGSATKTLQLAEGGKAVAETLGGRPVNPGTTDANERKLLNVVEEMAIASGVTVPQVYVLDGEPGINAFAAGHAPGDAVIGVTRGCMTLLSRDELQGVIGHEFSHILNGDMRLNLRLIGIIFGILCLATIGRVLLRARGSGRNRNALPLLGLALLLVGSIGVLFGRLIQAAVSRQREFLADASSVQFTRNPAGLSGALQKIGGLADGSRLESEHAADACHLFFGNALGGSFLNAMATHPPLADRIHALDPGWDGRFPRVDLAAAEKGGLAADARPQPLPRPPVFPLPGMPAAVGLVPPVIAAGAVMPTLGRPTPLHLRYAEALRNSFPASVQAAAREPVTAVALIYALMLSADPATREAQLAQLAQRITPTIYEKTVALLPEAASLAGRARLPLVNLALPALRHLRAGEFEQFNQALQWLIESDGQIDLFEFVLQKIIRRHLAPHFGGARPAVIQYYSLKPLVPDCAVVLSVLAQAGSADPAGVEKAFREGAPHLRAPDGGLTLLPREQCGLEQVDAVLDRLAQAAPQIKKNLIEACVYVVGADGVIQEREAELLRAVADTLDCPMPPFVQVE